MSDRVSAAKDCGCRCGIETLIAATPTRAAADIYTLIAARIGILVEIAT